MRGANVMTWIVFTVCFAAAEWAARLHTHLPVGARLSVLAALGSVGYALRRSDGGSRPRPPAFDRSITRRVSKQEEDRSTMTVTASLMSSTERSRQLSLRGRKPRRAAGPLAAVLILGVIVPTGAAARKVYPVDEGPRNLS